MKQQFCLLLLSAMAFSGCTSKEVFSSGSSYYLDTRHMASAGINWPDTLLDYPTPIQMYLSDHRNTPADTTPWANVYICTITKRNDTLRLKKDTIMILDTTYSEELKDTRLSDYWMNIQPFKPLRRCRIDLPAQEFRNIKKYKYQYGKVTLVTDD